MWWYGALIESCMEGTKIYDFHCFALFCFIASHPLASCSNSPWGVPAATQLIKWYCSLSIYLHINSINILHMALVYLPYKMCNSDQLTSLAPTVTRENSANVSDKCFNVQQVKRLTIRYRWLQNCTPSSSCSANVWESAALALKNSNTGAPEVSAAHLLRVEPQMLARKEALFCCVLLK